MILDLQYHAYSFWSSTTGRKKERRTNPEKELLFLGLSGEMVVAVPLCPVLLIHIQLCCLCLIKNSTHNAVLKPHTPQTQIDCGDFAASRAFDFYEASCRCCFIE